MATDVAWLVCVNIIKDSRYMLACEMAMYSLLTNRPHTHAHLSYSAFPVNVRDCNWMQPCALHTCHTVPFQ
jgi:hypothetical protein